jgi:hypothetical protein
MFSALAAVGCGRQPAEQRQDANLAAPKPEVAAPIPLPQPKLDRQQLIFATMQALSAAALGANDSDAQKQLKGREFELRLRFGCPGAPSDPSRNWSYDETSHALRTHFSADLAGERIPASDLLLKDYEGVAGFAIERPLLLSAGCPAAQFAPMNSAQRTIAVVQLFTSEDSRVQRPETSYDVTKAVEENEKPAEGLDLVIAGRLAELSDGRVIHCAAKDGPPACIISAKFDRVAIENPATGSVLGEWSQW